MKILIAVPDLRYPGGVTNYYKVIGLSNNKYIDYFYVGKYGAKFKSLDLIYRFLTFYRKVANYDIVHINPSFKTTSTWRELGFLIIAKARNKKTVVFFRGWDEKLERRILKSKILKNIFQFYNKADAFIVLGKVFEKKLLDLGIKEHHKFFVECTIAEDKHMNSFSIEKKIKSWNNKEIVRFLFISRIVKEKGSLLTIEIFNQIQRKYPTRKFQLIIAGDGPFLKQTEDYVSSQAITNVQFVGNVNNKPKYNLLAAADIMIFPTMYGEGMPNSILEGMLYGLPIISRAIAAIPEWVIENKNGFLSDSTEAKDFIPLVSKLIDDENLYKRIASSNHKKAVKLFTPDKVKNRIINIYNELIP